MLARTMVPSLRAKAATQETTSLAAVESSCKSKRNLLERVCRWNGQGLDSRLKSVRLDIEYVCGRDTVRRSFLLCIAESMTWYLRVGDQVATNTDPTLLPTAETSLVRSTDR